VKHRPRLSLLVAAALDPALAGTPFAPGQPGVPPQGRVDPAATPWPREAGSVIWCAGYDELQRAHPGLPQAHEQDDENHAYACVDLTLEFDRGGRLSETRLEGYSLADTLSEVGLVDDARRASELIGTPAEDACAALAGLLTDLLRTTAA